MSLPRLLCILLLMIVAFVFGCNSSQSDKVISHSAPVFRVADKPAILATIKDDMKPLSLIPPSGPEAHASTYSVQGVLFAGNGGGVAYTVGKDGKGFVVHNGKPGSLYKAFGSVLLSPDGSRIAYSVVADGKWRVVIDGVEGELFSGVGNLQFSPDGMHVIYQALKDDKWYLVVDTTVNKGSKTRYRTPQFSGDSSSIIYIDNIDDTDKGRLVDCDISFNKERIINSGVTSFVLNADRSAVAAISRNIAGRENVIQFDFAKPDLVMKGADFDKLDSLMFAPTGTDLVYFGERERIKYCVFNAHKEIVLEGLTPVNSAINQAGRSVGVLMSANKTSFLYQMFSNSGRKGKEYDEAEWLVYSRDGAVSAFVARKGKKWFVVTNGVEGPAFDRVVTPKFSPDGKYLVYRARKDGKRFAVVADVTGKVLRQHPAYEQVFDVQFTAGGKSVAYGVKDGKQLAWKVEKL